MELEAGMHSCYARQCAWWNKSGSTALYSVVPAHTIVFSVLKAQSDTACLSTDNKPLRFLALPDDMTLNVSQLSQMSCAQMFCYHTDMVAWCSTMVM